VKSLSSQPLTVETKRQQHSFQMCNKKSHSLFPEDAKTFPISKADAKKPCQMHFTKNV